MPCTKTVCTLELSEERAPKAGPASSAPAAAAGAPGPASPDNRLHALKQLLDQEVITPEEYEMRRKAILDSV